MKLVIHILKLLINKVDLEVKANPFSKIYGLGRSLIALSTLTVLLFNDIDLLFNENSLDIISSSKFIFNKINLFGILGYENLIVSKIISIFILVSVISGFLPQITGILHFWVIYSFHNSSILLDGGDQIATILTFMIVPLTLLDNRVNHWYESKNQKDYFKLVGHLVFKLIALQVSFIYFHTAIEKLYKIPDWRNGTALYYIFNNNYFGLNKTIKAVFDPIINSNLVFFFTWWVIISHLILAFILFLKRTNKTPYLFIGLSLHIGITLLMGLYSFGFTMIGALVLYILPFNFEIRWEIQEKHLKKLNSSTFQ